MAKTCIFCGDPANSMEDVFPLWIIRMLRRSAAERVPMRTYRYRQPPREWMTLNSVLKAKLVCRACNNGWMSRLEDQLKPIFTPMILGNPVTVTPSQQERICTWLTKCALLFDAMDDGEVFYDALDRHHFRRKVEPFYNGVNVWLGHYAGTNGRAFFDHRTLRAPVSSGNSVKMHVLTISLGKVVLQMGSVKMLDYKDMGKNFEMQPIGPRFAEATVQIWPMNLGGISWPPAVSLNDTDKHMKFLAYRFGGDKV